MLWDEPISIEGQLFSSGKGALLSLKTLTFSTPYDIPFPHGLEAFVARGTELYGLRTGPDNGGAYYEPYCFQLSRLNVETRHWEEVDLSIMDAPYLKLNSGGLDTVCSIGFGTVEVAGDYYIFGAYAPPAELNFWRKTLRTLPEPPREVPIRSRSVSFIDNIRLLHPRLTTDNAPVLPAPSN